VLFTLSFEPRLEQYSKSHIKALILVGVSSEVVYNDPVSEYEAWSEAREFTQGNRQNEVKYFLCSPVLSLYL
jgi:hypothetical protein